MKTKKRGESGPGDTISLFFVPIKNIRFTLSSKAAVTIRTTPDGFVYARPFNGLLEVSNHDVSYYFKIGANKNVLTEPIRLKVFSLNILRARITRR